MEEENKSGLVNDYNIKDDEQWPWCEACGSYHHPDNPTCRLKSRSEPLKFSYDPSMDVLWVEGMPFSGAIFRTWKIPENKIYKFSRLDGLSDAPVVIEEVFPCESCAQKFQLYRKCRVCGCTKENPCVVKNIESESPSERPCHWTLPNLCSACDPSSEDVLVHPPLSPAEWAFAQKTLRQKQAEATERVLVKAGVFTQEEFDALKRERH